MAKTKVSIKKKAIKKKKTETAIPEAEFVSFKLSKLLLVLAVIAVVVLAVVFIPKLLNREPKPSEIAATVNGEEILWADVEARYERLTPEYKAVLTKEAILNQSVDELLLLQLAIENYISVDAAELNGLIDRVVAQFGEEEFNRRLEAQGITAEDFTKQLEDTLIINEYLQSELPELRVTDEDIETFFEENKELMAQPEMVRAYHILLNSTEDAEKVLELLEEGGDFEELAAEYSIGPSAPNGGDIGYISRDMVVPEFGDAAFALGIGEISDIVESEYGFHIIKITERIEAEEADLEEMRSLIKFNLFDAKFRENQEMVREFINNARTGAEIEILRTE